MNDKTIVIAGGTGFIGTSVARYFSHNNRVIILTRNTAKSINNNYKSNTALVHANVQYIIWDGKTQGAWSVAIDGADIVINLAGKSVNCRYTDSNKKQIFDSRVYATKAIGQAIKNAQSPPKLWINAASATIYRHATDHPQDEYTGEIQNDFSVQVCKLWEKTFFEQSMPVTRQVALRMAVTLGNGGVMIPYLNLCKYGLGGRQGTGRQMYSWVHAEDVCRIIDFAWQNQTIAGVYNVSSPNPVTNKIFMQTLRKTTGHKFGLPAYKWMLAIGAKLIGTEPELLLKSRWVLPVKLLQAGFQFRYPNLQDAFQQIVDELPRKTYHLF